MEPDEEINRFKTIFKRQFEEQGLEVHLDISLSESVGWRPHVFAKNDVKILLDIVDTEEIPDIQLRKYTEFMNDFPDLGVCVAMIGKNRYDPKFIVSCTQYGIGIFVIENDTVKQVLEPRSRNVETLTQTDQIGILPNAPFGNSLSLKRCFRKCKEYLHWFENNLPKKCLEIIYENVIERNLTEIDSIKLLRSLDDKVGGSFRKEFVNLRDELSSHNIDTEMRVILDRSVTREVHGRYLYSRDRDGREVKIQLPPLNSLEGNQWDSIFTNVAAVPAFDHFWEAGKDLLADWSEIDRARQEYLKRRAEEEERRLRVASEA